MFIAKLFLSHAENLCRKVSSASRRQALSTVGSNRKLSVTIENNHSGGSELVKSRENTIKKPIIVCCNTNPTMYPHKLLKKKKTIAFGRTTNVSQTVEVSYLHCNIAICRSFFI